MKDDYLDEKSMNTDSVEVKPNTTTTQSLSEDHTLMESMSNEDVIVNKNIEKISKFHMLNNSLPMPKIEEMLNYQNGLSSTS